MQVCHFAQLVLFFFFQIVVYHSSLRFCLHSLLSCFGLTISNNASEDGMFWVNDGGDLKMPGGGKNNASVFDA